MSVISISLEEFKLIKQFYPDFIRKEMSLNAFTIGWSELMPVVEKIADLERTPPPNYTGYRIEMVPNGYVKITGFGFPMQSIQTNVSIEKGFIQSVYKAVVEFIKWYKETTDQTVQ